MKEKNQQKQRNLPIKTHSFQPLTAYIRSNGIEEVRTFVEDNWESVKLLSQNTSDTWLSEDHLKSMYNYYSLFMHSNFRHIEEPKRCSKALVNLTDIVYKYMKTKYKRVSKSLLKTTLRFVIKHVSRLAYHKYHALRYSRDENFYSKNKHVSYSYLLDITHYLEVNDFIVSFNGFCSDDGANVKSMMVVSTEFIHLCIGSNKIKTMEECLRERQEKLYIIRERYINEKGKPDKRERGLHRGEKEMANSIEEAMIAFDKHLENFTINMNGVNIPETFFYRTFIQDFEHGGRYSCAVLQNKPKSERLTTVIDGCQTASLDFWAMHLCIAAELEGWCLGEHDPYQSKVSPYTNWYEVEVFAKEHKLTHYNPHRNLYKLILLTCLNAKDRTGAIKGISSSLFKDSRRKNKGSRKFVGVSCVDRLPLIVDSVLKHNRLVDKYFNSDFGIKAQYYESQIAQYCVDTFVKLNKVCFPVHDSITVKVEDIELGLQIMEEGYRKVLGSTLNCRIDIETL